MNRLKSLAGLVATSCLVFGACGGGSGDGDPDAGGNPMFDAGDVADAGERPDANVPEPDAAPMLTGIDAVCATDGPFAGIFEKASECNPNFDFQKLFGTDLFAGEAMAQVCLDILQPQLDSTTVSIDDSKLQACVDFVAGAECVELDIDNIDSTPCGEIFVGTVVTDGECDVDAQCVGDAFCTFSQMGCGSCQNRLPLGASCQVDAQCSDGKCNQVNECAAPVGLDGACVGGRDCAGLLVCSQATDTCVDPTPQVGDLCVLDNQCGGVQSGMHCADGDPSTCQLLPQPGEACVDVDNLGNQPICDLINYVWCLPSANECQAPAISGLGEPCNPTALIGVGARKCEPGLMCSDPLRALQDGIPGTCLAPRFEGESCTVDTGDNDLTEVCHPNYTCSDEGLCEGDFDFTGVCPAP